MLEEGISSKNWQHFTYCLFSYIVLSPCPRWVKLAPSKSNVTLMWSRKIPAKSYFDPSMESKLPLELKRPFRGVETTLFPKGRKWPLGVKTTLLNLQCRYIEWTFSYRYIEFTFSYRYIELTFSYRYIELTFSYRYIEFTFSYRYIELTFSYRYIELTFSYRYIELTFSYRYIELTFSYR
jgi:hypothetical protein